MGFLSKVWKGVKGAVSKVAKGVKKVAKKIAYAVPGGKQGWDLSSKIGKGIEKGIGKIANALGPVGMMALSFVLAPVIGPMIGALWAGFGAGAAAMAASANVLVSTLGSIGTGIFAAGNFVVGTLGAMGSAVTEGAANVMAGNFSGAASAFASNMTAAFTGEAGMAAVNAAAAQAASTAGTLASDAASQLTTEQATQLAADGVVMHSPVDPTIGQAGLTDSQIAAQDALFGNGTEAAQAALNSSPVGNTGIPGIDTGLTTAQLDAQVAEYGMTVDQLNATPNAANAYITNGTDGVRGIAEQVISKPNNTGDNIKESLDKAQQLKELMDQVNGNTNTQGAQGRSVGSGGRAITSTQANAGNTKGQGSSGFSLLGGVMGLEQSVRNSQNMLFA